MFRFILKDGEIIKSYDSLKDCKLIEELKNIENGDEIKIKYFENENLEFIIDVFKFIEKERCELKLNKKIMTCLNYLGYDLNKLILKIRYFCIINKEKINSYNLKDFIEYLELISDLRQICNKYNNEINNKFYLELLLDEMFKHLYIVINKEIEINKNDYQKLIKLSNFILKESN